MSDRVSGHSGLPESVELKQMEIRAEKMQIKREKQLNMIYGVLDKMPEVERRTMLTMVFRHYMKKEALKDGSTTD